MSWHKCFLCGCEYRDDFSESRFGYCPGCREPQTQKETQKETQDEKPTKKHV